MPTDPATPSGKAPAHRNAPRYARLAAAAFLLLLILSLAAGYAIYVRLAQNLELGSEAMLARVAEIESARVGSWVKERKADAVVFSSPGFLADRMQEASVPGAGRKRLQQQLEAIRASYNYLEVAVHDVDGSVLATSEPGVPPPESVTADIVQRALDSRTAEVSALHFTERDGVSIPVVDIAIPIATPDRDTALLLRAGLGFGLSPMAASAIALPVATGALLAEASERDVRVAAGGGTGQFFAYLDALPLTPETLAAHVHNGRQFRLQAADGTRLHAVARKVAGVPWYLLSIVREGDVHAAARRIAWGVGLAWLATLALLGTVLLLWWRRMDAEYRLGALRAATEHRMLRRRYDFLSRYANDLILLADGAGRVVEVNDRACEMLGRARGEVIGTVLARLFPADCRSSLETAITALRPGSAATFELYLEDGGHRRWFDASARAIELEGRHIVQIICRDITERRQAELALRETDETMNKILGSILDIVWSFSPDLKRVNYINESVERVFGRPRADFIERPRLWLELVIPEDRQAVEERLRGLGPDNPVWEYEYRIRRSDGCLRWLHCRGQLAFDWQGRPLRLDGVASDITERKTAQQQVQTLAYFDHVTGLPNRQLLNDRLTLALSMAQRKGRKVALLFMDLDNFKHINDSLGHHAGDMLLHDIAKRLEQCVRAEDTVARIGGDEFQVMLPELERGGQAATVAEKILAATARPIRVDDNEIHTTMSIGISLFPDDARNPVELAQHADSAMYQAKSHGRANYQFFTEELNRQITRAAEIERLLRQALDGGELSLWYQPQIDTRSFRLIGAEALLRWRGPDGRYLSPLEFIPVAEERGLINRIGEWVMREACAQCRHWQEMGLQPVPVAVNVSPIQFQQKGFASQVTGILADARLDATLLELEITESAIMKRAPQVAELATRLREVGVGISIDDFGTGYSSLSYLKQIPIDKIKIDRSFIADMLEDEDDLAITGAIVGLARNLRLRVIAEGVESHAQIERLRGLGCDEVQGFYFSQAVSGGDFAAFLAGARVLEPAAGQAGAPV